MKILHKFSIISNVKYQFILTVTFIITCVEVVVVFFNVISNTDKLTFLGYRNAKHRAPTTKITQNATISFRVLQMTGKCIFISLAHKGG